MDTLFARADNSGLRASGVALFSDATLLLMALGMLECIAQKAYFKFRHAAAKESTSPETAHPSSTVVGYWQNQRCVFVAVGQLGGLVQGGKRSVVPFLVAERFVPRSLFDWSTG